METNRDLWLVTTTMAAPVSWGTTYVTVSELLPPGRPLLVAAGRVVPAGLVLVALGATKAGWRPRVREWPSLLALATCNFALFFPLLIVAAYRLPGGVAAAAGGLQPLLVAVGTSLAGGGRPRRATVVAAVAAAAGVALVVVRPGASIDPLGVVAAVAANVSFAVGVVLTKRVAPATNRLAATGWQLLLAGAVLVPLALAVEGSPPAIGPREIAGFAYFGLVATGAAFVLWFRGVRRLPATVPPMLGLAAPLTGALLGWVVLGQDLSPVQLAGFAIVITAVANAARPAATPRERYLMTPSVPSSTSTCAAAALSLPRSPMTGGGSGMTSMIVSTGSATPSARATALASSAKPSR